MHSHNLNKVKAELSASLNHIRCDCNVCEIISQPEDEHAHGAISIDYRALRIFFFTQSRIQSTQAPWSANGRWIGLRDNSNFFFDWLFVQVPLRAEA